MPARRKNKKVRRKRLKYKNLNNSKKRVFNYKLFALIIVGAGVIFSFSLLPRSWQKDTRLTMVIDSSPENVYVSVFSPDTKEITNIIIPASVEVESTRQLGTFRLGALWQLGVNEDVDGVILAESITKNFKFPVTQWASSDFIGFSEGELKPMLSAVFLPNKTSLKIRDRIQLFFFSLGIKEFKRKDVNLADTHVINKKVLLDGQEGYEISANVPQSILAIFSDSDISASNTTVMIKDYTGRYGVSDEVGEIVQVLGAKVASVTREDQKSFDCEVSGKRKEDVYKIATLFSCKQLEEVPEGSFDVEIRLGEEFVRRF